MVLSKFVTCIAFVYGIYYVANILWDIRKSKRANSLQEQQTNAVREIVHDEITPAEKITDDTHNLFKPVMPTTDKAPENASGSPASIEDNKQNNKPGLVYDMSLEILHGQGLEVSEFNIKKAVEDEEALLQNPDEERISSEDFAEQLVV